MLGAIILAVIIVVVIPVAVCMSGAVAAAILGSSLTTDADSRYQGSELVELNK